jgi:hypothetical protein
MTSSYSSCWPVMTGKRVAQSAPPVFRHSAYWEARTAMRRATSHCWAAQRVGRKNSGSLSWVKYQARVVVLRWAKGRVQRWVKVSHVEPGPAASHSSSVPLASSSRCGSWPNGVVVGV